MILSLYLAVVKICCQHDDAKGQDVCCVTIVKQFLKKNRWQGLQAQNLSFWRDLKYLKQVNQTLQTVYLNHSRKKPLSNMSK